MFAMRNSKISSIILKLVQTISFILGLATQKVELSTVQTAGIALKFSYSRLGCAYNIFLLIILFLTNFYCLPYNIDEWDLFNSPLLMVVLIIVVIIKNTTVAIIRSIYWIYQQCIIDIGNQLTGFDEKYGSKLF